MGWPVYRSTAAEKSNGSAPAVPEPVVKIDNQTDPFATVVTVEFGDKLGELLDTVSFCYSWILFKPILVMKLNQSTSLSFSRLLHWRI